MQMHVLEAHALGGFGGYFLSPSLRLLYDKNGRRELEKKNLYVMLSKIGHGSLDPRVFKFNVQVQKLKKILSNFRTRGWFQEGIFQVSCKCSNPS
ncbi:hypothetical protein Hdeb2414_s0003g00102361 [Helianthus debilis subsp. tardiflorus]